MTLEWITTRLPGWRRLVALVAVVATLAFLAVACNGDDDSNGDTASGLAGLRGKTIGVASFGGTFTLETRFLLQEKYGLDVSLEGGDVRFTELGAESLPALLSRGEIDAAVLLHLGAFAALNDESFRLLSRITNEVSELTGAPIMNSILVTYPDVADEKNAALVELNRMLGESVAYFKANQDDVIQAVAEEQDFDPAFLNWWWDRQDMLLGDLSTDMQQRLLDVWQAAVTIGDIEGFPEFSDVLFSPNGDGMDGSGDRVTVSIAVLDDPSRAAALFAIEQGIVTSDFVDVEIAFLPLSTIIDVAPAKQFDVIEATPLAVPRAAAGGFDFVILSAALQNLDGTLLFVRADE
ncbi:MAG: hypothetical protein IH958_00665 [Chloroflexi bacterium]|nr:hypothetical protein [Chloroflexota bacterium]